MSSTNQNFDHGAAHIPGVTGPSDPVEFDAWAKNKISESLADPRPAVPHADVAAEMERVIQAAEYRQRESAPNRSE